MQSFNYYLPTEMVFGKDAESQTADLVKKHGGSRVFIVYGKGSVLESGLIDKMKTQLSNSDIKYDLIGGVQPNPTLSFTKQAIERAKEFNADFILAVGGGSVIDTAKGVAHGTANPDADIWDYWTDVCQVEKSLPVGCVLTISAAGSETSVSSVLTNDLTGEKRGLSTSFNRPVFAVMNPELTFTLPKYQIACGIVDIMMHTLDRYFTQTEGNEMTDEIAEALLRTTIKNGSVAMMSPRDYQAMSEIMWCGSLSHNGITGLGAVTDFAPHQMGHELSGKFDVAHGASLSTVWGSWAAYCWQAKPQRFARYARKVWGIDNCDDNAAVQEGIEKTVEYFSSLGMPTCFSELGIGVQSSEVIDDLATRCVFYGKRTIGSFKVLDKCDVQKIYSLANR